MQVLANLAIVLTIPAGGREGKGREGCYSGDGSAHPGRAQKNLQRLQTQPVLLSKLFNTSGRRKAPHAASSQEQNAILTSLPLSSTRDSPSRSAGPPARPGSVLTAEVVEAGEIHDLSPKPHGGAGPPGPRPRLQRRSGQEEPPPERPGAGSGHGGHGSLAPDVPGMGRGRLRRAGLPPPAPQVTLRAGKAGKAGSKLP